jgi:hypothetical protein
MKYFTQTLVLISMLALWMPALAQGGDGDNPPPLILSDDQTMVRLGRYMQILEDPTGELTIQDVSSSEYSNKYIASKVEAPNFGYSSSTYWVRFQLRFVSANGGCLCLQTDWRFETFRYT